MSSPKLIAALSAAVVCTFLAGPAAANHRPSDSSVEASDRIGDVDTKLDLAFVGFAGRGDGTADLTITTEEGWDCECLRNEPLGGYTDGDGVFLWWDVDGDGDGYFEGAAHFRCRGRMVLEMSRTGEVFAAHKPDRRTVRVTLPLMRLGLDVASLRLRASSQVNGVSDGQVFLDETDASPVLTPVPR